MIHIHTPRERRSFAALHELACGLEAHEDALVRHSQETFCGQRIARRGSNKALCDHSVVMTDRCSRYFF